MPGSLHGAAALPLPPRRRRGTGGAGSRADRSGGAGGATTTGTPGGKNLGPCTRLMCSEKVMMVVASSSVRFVNARQRGKRPPAG